MDSTTGCAHHWQIKDEELERSVIRGILHDPQTVFGELQRMNFTVSDYGFDNTAVAHTELFEMFVAYERIDLVSFYDRMRRLRVAQTKSGRVVAPFYCDSFGERHQFVWWLVNTWSNTYWWDDIVNWWPAGHDIPENGGTTKLSTCIALAAAAKVQWLAARRNAIYRANEVIRDSLNPCREGEYYDRYTNEE